MILLKIKCEQNILTYIFRKVLRYHTYAKAGYMNIAFLMLKTEKSIVLVDGKLFVSNNL